MEDGEEDTGVGKHQSGKRFTIWKEREMSEMTLEQARAMVAEAEKQNEFPAGVSLMGIAGGGSNIAFVVSGYVKGFNRDNWVELTKEEVATIRAIHAAAMARAGK